MMFWVHENLFVDCLATRNEADLDEHLLKTQQRGAAAFKSKCVLIFWMNTRTVFNGSAEFSEASLQVSMTVANVLRTNQEVQKLTNPDIRAAMVEVLADCPKEFHSGTVGKVQVCCTSLARPIYKLVSPLPDRPTRKDKSLLIHWQNFVVY